jgi:SAM-dependent methyltransferase
MDLTTRELPYVCPQCRSNLSESPEAYHCLSCRRRYPIVLGIPDFRVFADPYISIEDDYRKARVLAERSAEMTFAELLAHYWAITPGVPGPLINQYVHGALRHRERSRATWAMIRSTDSPTGRSGLLDIGCGTAGFLAAIAPTFSSAVGIDIAFRWLIVARKRLEELQMRNVALVCACAESLPFPDAAFDLVVAEDVLDHTRDQEASVQEGARVLRHGGVLYLTTPNRYSLAPDPHVWVWGVGFLPPPLRDRYVRWRKGIPYGPIRPVSYMALRRLLDSAVLRRCRVVWPDLADLDAQHLSRWQRTQLRLYGLVRTTPGLRHLLRLIGPVFHVLCHKAPN